MGERMLLSLFSVLGAIWFVGIFWLLCWISKWDVPTWAYFIVGWMGQLDFHTALTYKKDSTE